jgi:hypothetical protein
MASISKLGMAGFVDQGGQCSDMARFLDVRGQTTYDEAHAIINEKECHVAIDLAVQLLKQASRFSVSELHVLRTSMWFAPWLNHNTYP